MADEGAITNLRLIQTCFEVRSAAICYLAQMYAPAFEIAYVMTSGMSDWHDMVCFVINATTRGQDLLYSPKTDLTRTTAVRVVWRNTHRKPRPRTSIKRCVALKVAKHFIAKGIERSYHMSEKG